MPPHLADLKTYTRNAILLGDALRRVSALSPERQADVRATCEAASRRAGIADQLADEQSAVASLILYREAFPLYAKAVVLLHDPGADLAGVATLAALAERGAIPALPVTLPEAEQILAAGSFDGWSTEELLAKRKVVSGAVRFLRNLAEPRTARELKDSRISRVALTTVLGLAVLGGIGWRLLRLPNLALDKPVTISARFAYSAAPADNTGLTNGKIDLPYGIHTTLGGGWVMVDLQRVYRISEVRTFNRADCCFNDGLPLTLEFSADGKDFVQKDQHSEPFSAQNPWIYEAHGAKARYVRIRSNQYVALTELEVYGRR